MKISHMLLPLLATGLLFSCTCCDAPVETASDSQSASSQAIAPMAAVELGEMRKLHLWGGVYLGSQPSEADLALFKDSGLASVINMRKSAEMQFDESSVAQGLGLGYSHIGWNGPDELTDELFDSFRELMNQAQQPMLVHCASSNRVGAIWMVWRALDQGASVETALAEAKMAGMRTPGYETKALDYISRNSK
ncbi:MAG: hypothetical protein JKY61_04770 [Planctomycetes bacterium]|nr:hypothetical protein [Planctomycetota bacterium]